MLFLTFFLITVLVPGSAVKVHGAPSELYYDDGGPDIGWSDFYPIAAAVRFSPPSQSWKIEAVRLHGVCYLRGEDSDFVLEIWDEKLNAVYHAKLSLCQTFEGENSTLDWHTVEVPDVLVAGDFYVVVAPCLMLDGPQLWISVDDDQPVENRSSLVNVSDHKVIGSLGTKGLISGDFMIRVVGGLAPLPPELRIVSVEFGTDKTTLEFRLSGGRIVGANASLVRAGGDEEACAVSLEDDHCLLVYAPGSGTLDVIVTTDSGTVGTSLELGCDLRYSYQETLRELSILMAQNETMGKRVDALEREKLKLLEELNATRLNAKYLLEDIDDLNRDITAKESEIESLRTMCNLLAAGLVATTSMLFIVLALRVRKKWRP